MSNVMVRYKVKPEQGAENERLVRAVYDELAPPQRERFRAAAGALLRGAARPLLRRCGVNTARPTALRAERDRRCMTPASGATIS